MVEQSTYTMPEHGWTCFHCGENFKKLGAARDHFGWTPHDDPVCRVPRDPEFRGLVMKLRKAEAPFATLAKHLGCKPEDLNVDLVALVDACSHILAWLESDQNGPDYGSQTRVTHPEGEQIWKEWWERQLRLCELAEETARHAVSQIPEHRP